MKWVKALLWIITGLVVLAGIVPYLPADILRPSIERALERGLGRKVDIGEVRLTLLPGPLPRPGITLERVTIHEDPRAGIEPLAYVESLGASIRLLSLFQRRLEFSSLNLGGASTGATINLVKTDAGPWNFQFLMEGGAADSKRIPAIRMRGGRVNFKFGDTKASFYFNDADLDVNPSEDGSVELRFGGAPSRTDRSAQEFGRFFVRGTVAPASQHLDLQVELERSSLAETLRWIDPRGFGVHGTVALDAQLSGPPSRLNVTGQMHVADVHRWDLLPNQSGGLAVGFGGSLDLHGELLDLHTVAAPGSPPVVVRFRSWDFLKTPHWEAAADVQQVPLATLLAIGRHMGVAWPENLEAQGQVSGSVTYDEPAGMRGRVELRDASLMVPDAEPVKAPEAAVDIDGRWMRLERTSVHIGEKQSADIEGTYNLDPPRSVDLKITTRGLGVAATRSFGLEAIPLLDQTPQGTWRGWARYQDGVWSGESELQNAKIAVDGLADPLLIKSASVNLTGTRVALSRMRAQAGTVEVTGSYRWDRGAEPEEKAPADKFDLKIAEAEVGELARLFAPTMVRGRGFLARTLRLGADAPVPTWLKALRAEGAISIGSLTAGDVRFTAVTAKVNWKGPLLKLTDLSASSDPAAVSGDFSINLSRGTPRYRFEGKAADVPYKGGRLDLEGTLDAEGEGLALLESTKAEGVVRGRSILFAQDADFRTLTARFQMEGVGPASRWKLSNVEVNQSGESLAGTGASQADGRLVLELMGRGKPLRYSGTLFPVAAQ